MPGAIQVRCLQTIGEREIRGLGDVLIALEAGKTLLVLDTASGDAERLYARQGWQRLGVIPNYALMPDGAPCATTVFFKSLGA